MGKSLNIVRGARGDPREVSTTLPLVARGGAASVLLRQAQLNLRCLDWANVSLKLLTSDKHGNEYGVDDVSPGVSPSTPPPAARRTWLPENTFDLSRPLKPGEVIDFFLSHSWHDNAKEKWSKLCQFGKAFHSLHGRYPTIWLDKVCIDQANISEGLRVLPVNVMACKQMLVLCGPTYTERLWCAWELCTLFSFMSMEVALDKVVLLPIDSTAFGERHEIGSLEKLKTFDVADARCYDPNEEEVLRRIIGTVGDGHFNDRIRELGKACERIGTKGFVPGRKLSVDSMASDSTPNQQSSSSGSRASAFEILRSSKQALKSAMRKASNTF